MRFKELDGTGILKAETNRTTGRRIPVTDFPAERISNQEFLEMEIIKASASG
jgi:hypothetical protein